MIQVILDDITKVELDAIINSANKSLLSGSGVCGVIHKAAGKELEIECKKYGPLEEGNSIITKGYNLKSRNVIHTVAPKYYLLQENREELLRSCYYTSLKLADENNLKAIGYPAIGIGVYKWPIELALTIAVEEVAKYMKHENRNIDNVYFIVRDERLKKAYEFLIGKYTIGE